MNLRKIKRFEEHCYSISKSLAETGVDTGKHFLDHSNPETRKNSIGLLTCIASMAESDGELGACRGAEEILELYNFCITDLTKNESNKYPNRMMDLIISTVSIMSIGGTSNVEDSVKKTLLVKFSLAISCDEFLECLNNAKRGDQNSIKLVLLAITGADAASLLMKATPN
jgi:hypothetical protein